MTNTYTAIFKREGNWWIGWIEEVPGVNCQERTRAALLKTLRVTLKEMIRFNNEIVDHLARKICKDLGISFVR